MTMSQLIGKKIGMTRVFTDAGVSIPVTVVAFEVNHVSSIMSVERNGYAAIQLATIKKRKPLTKAEAGHLKKNELPQLSKLKEFRLESDYAGKVGDTFTASIFENISHVDVQSRTKGCGFQGVIKRHNFSSQDASHGNSLAHRVPGSTGGCQDPGKVWKNKALPGQYGNTVVTTQSLSLVKVDTSDPDLSLAFIKGAVPGPNGGIVYVTKALKKSAKAEV